MTTYMGFCVSHGLKAFGAEAKTVKAAAKNCFSKHDVDKVLIREVKLIEDEDGVSINNIRNVAWIGKDGSFERLPRI